MCWSMTGNMPGSLLWCGICSGEILIIGLIAIVVIVALVALGPKIRDMFDQVNDSIDNIGKEATTAGSGT